MFYAVARNQNQKPICAIRFDRDKNEMLVVGKKEWVETLKRIYKDQPTLGWIMGQKGTNPLQAGAGSIPQMNYFKEDEGADQFSTAMSEMNGADVKTFEPFKVDLEASSNGS